MGTVDITAVINGLIEEFGTHPALINQGRCVDFAWAVVQEVPGASDEWDADDPECPFENAQHCFVEYRRRYYDAECPEGVDHWLELPYYQGRV